MATTLVTGGAGFIGRRVVERLAQDGHEVVVLDALTYAAHPGALQALSNALPVQLVEGDVATPQTVEAVFARVSPELVFHLAAETHVDRSLDDAAPFLRTNVHGTWEVAQACLRHGVQRLVHVSSDEVYGDRSGLSTSVETDPTTPTNPYSASKACADHLVLATVRSHGLDAVVTRGANTYGPGQFPEKLLPLAARRWAAGKSMGIYGDGQQVRHWLYVDDHADGIVAAAGAPSGAVLHFGGEQATNREILARWASALGVDGRTETIADRPGHDRIYDLDDARTRAMLGWKPAVSLQDGLARTAVWQAEHPDFWDDALSRDDVRAWFARQYGSP